MLIKSTSIIECENGLLSPSENFQKFRFSLQAAANCQEPIQKTLELLALAAEQRWAFIHFARTIDRSARHCAACYRHTVPTARGVHVRP